MFNESTAKVCVKCAKPLDAIEAEKMVQEHGVETDSLKELLKTNLEEMRIMRKRIEILEREKFEKIFPSEN